MQAELPLPVAGLLSDLPLGEVVDATRACVEAARALGCEVPSPFQSLAFLALSVIPSLKITDRGLVDVDRFELVPLRRVRTLYGARTSSRWTTRGRRTPTAGCSSRTGRGRRRWATIRPLPTQVSTSVRIVTPGLVNTHHHLYQTLTRAHATEADLFTWLRALYPVWSGIDVEAEYAAAHRPRGARPVGCTTVFDHHYVFPRGRTGLIEAEVQAARELGLRLVASRGSMDLGESDGGLPPDELVEDPDAVLADTERLAARCTRPGRARASRSPLRPARPSRSPGG